MTTFNGGPFIAEQIDSILAQTFADFELIIADDGSTDSTAVLLRDYARRDGRIQFIVNAVNLGINKNLEQVMRLARGEFIAIADQDDIWEPNKLEVLLAAIGSASAVYSDSLLIDESGRSLGMTLLERLSVAVPASGNQAAVVLRRNCVSGHAMLFRRALCELALPFDHRLMFDQQLGFLAAIDKGLVFVGQPLIRHRIHGANQTNRGMIPGAPPPKGSSGRLALIQRLERYRRRRLELAERLQFAQVCLERAARHKVSLKNDRGLIRKLTTLASRLQAFDQTWFDAELFLLMWSLRKQIFFASEARVFKRCINYSKGARYYQWGGRWRGEFG